MIKIFLAAGLTTVGDSALFVIFPPFLDVQGYPVGQIGLIIALFSMSQLLSRLPSGLLYRREWGRWIAAVSVGVLGLSTAAFAWLPQAPFLLVWTALHGLAFGVAGTVLLALALDTRPEGRSAGAIMGWYTALLSGGHAVGNSFSGLIADQLGFNASFLIAGAVQVPGVLLCLTLPAYAPARAATPAAATPARPSLGGWQRMLRAIRNPSVLKASLLALYMQFLDSAVNAFFPIFALGAGLSLTLLGIVKTVKNLSATLVRTLTGPIVAWVGLTPLNTALVLAFAVAVFALPFGYGPLAFAPLFAVIGVCRGLLRATSAALLVQGDANVRGRRLGVASGIYNSALDAGGVVSPILAGFVAASVGIGPMFQIVAVALLASTVAVTLWVRRMPPPPTTEEPPAEAVPTESDAGSIR